MSFNKYNSDSFNHFLHIAKNCENIKFNRVESLIISDKFECLIRVIEEEQVKKLFEKECEKRTTQIGYFIKAIQILNKTT